MLEPNRNYVIEDDGSIHKMLFCGDTYWEYRATTSIQEIRAKAIDEFAERMCNACSAKSTGLYSANGFIADILTLDGITETVVEIAEQLKGGAE